MKFVVVAIVLAAVFGVECSVIIPGLSYTAVSGPGIIAAAPGIATIRGPAVAPLSVAIASPVVAPAVVAPVVAAQGSYVAQTRGAVHVAPLEGHANSAASINLEAAPGTV
ncbi:adult cuticle protein 1-like [Hermetia illucens]|uniref:adult cuticle protein 1-like n=1 Tax=Hermetia illucens TaxID=343691 RepID=UPI0018CC1436|nr:adult cuticle protein 1-like [Hermetia illucens]